MFLYSISPIIAVVDWTLAASPSQSLSSSRSGKLFMTKPWATCSALSYFYGIPAVNTWPVGRHMALLNKMVNDKIENHPE